MCCGLHDLLSPEVYGTTTGYKGLPTLTVVGTHTGWPLPSHLVAISAPKVQSTSVKTTLLPHKDPTFKPAAHRHISTSPRLSCHARNSYSGACQAHSPTHTSSNGSCHVHGLTRTLTHLGGASATQDSLGHFDYMAAWPRSRGSLVMTTLIQTGLKKPQKPKSMNVVVVPDGPDEEEDMDDDDDVDGVVHVRHTIGQEEYRGCRIPKCNIAIPCHLIPALVDTDTLIISSHYRFSGLFHFSQRYIPQQLKNMPLAHQHRYH
ncbi:hypothetical protein NDU88_005607 [Pleurodeles waltl]|uniref:Uncharacterized protein n=1 Tax=Pleurodeles waltl TaxID=8319 RepID=A0AAV7WYR4_PLEWA|nr:hypothetical protein NDU88_005607 [Pleurodeles waltl]